MKNAVVKNKNRNVRNQHNNNSLCDAEKSAYFKKNFKSRKKIQKEKRKRQQEQLRQKLADDGNKEDDLTIHKLERLMKIKPGRKNEIPSAFVDDGLDYILDILDGKGNVEGESDNVDKGKALSKDNNTAKSNTKYIPPAFRKLKSNNEIEKLNLLKRQMKGLLNRLSDSNMKSICNEIENLFITHSRAQASHVLTDLILDQLYTPDPIPEKLIIESAMVVAVLSHNIGTEVIGYFLEVIVNKLNDLLNTRDYGEGKKSNNLIQLICSLYQLKITQKQLILDMIEIFLKSFSERDVELMVVILKATGFQLRKDDPVSLKSIVEQTTLKSVTTQGEQSPRMKFMLEILTAIKNNNVRKVLDYDTDAINSRRKKIKSICVKESDEFADVTYKDLVNVKQQGRWWIVGSSWGGAPMLKPVRESDGFDMQVSENIKKAARKLRMNTDVRKRIFYAVMSADDFVDAFESIFRLGLKGKQMREVSHVLMKCCEEEKSFNPFYYHLLNKFCHHDREFIITVQCSFWDRFKSFQTLPKKNLNNLAKLLSCLLLSEALPLSSLKTIEYSEIDKAGVAFLRNVFANIATGAKSLVEVEKVFAKLDPVKFSSVRNGLRLFIQHFMLKDSAYIKENLILQEALERMNRQLDTQRQSFYRDGLF